MTAKFSKRIIYLVCLQVLAFFLSGTVQLSAQALQDARGGMDVDFPPAYEVFLPGYKNTTAEAMEGDSKKDAGSVTEAGEAGSSFFSRIFSDRTALNIILLVFGFVIFIFYRLRSGKIRR